MYVPILFSDSLMYSNDINTNYLLLLCNGRVGKLQEKKHIFLLENIGIYQQSTITDVYAVA